MSSPLRRNALRRAGARIDIPVAAAAWLCGWLVANVIGTIVITASGAEDVDEAQIWVLFLGTALGWAAFIVAMLVASRRDGSGDFVVDYRLRFAPSDVVGVGAGVLAQLVLLPLIYLPLENLWPDTFSDDKLTENAKELVDRATGASMVLLVLMVCVGAPVVEELVYRGLIQGTLANRIHHVGALVLASAWFAGIHFRPVEYPGLFAAGMVFGAAALMTGRLGTAMAAHLGFNVTGLVLALD